MEIFLIKNRWGLLEPFDDAEVEKTQKLPSNQMLRCKLTRIRNERFFKKWHVLVKYAFDMWNPQNYYGFPVEKSYDHFRKMITMKAGFIKYIYHIDGSYTAEAESIAFDKMDEEAFQELYSNTVNVVLEFTKDHYEGADLEEVIDNMIRQFG